MKLKSRKKTIAILLSLALASTGCSKAEEVDVKDGYQKRIENALAYNKLYTDDSIFKINKATYEDFYNTFFCAAVENMTDEEYLKFSSDLASTTTYNYNLKNLFYCIDDMLTIDKNSFGHGFYSMFKHQLMAEEVDPGWYLSNETFSHINTLRTIVNNDAEFYSSVFSRDINKVIDCICKNTNVTDRALVEELILKLDQYYEVFGSTNYQYEKLASRYETRIQEIMNIIVKTKCETDSAFNQTLYAKILKESKYYDHSQISIYQELFGLNAGYVNDNYQHFYHSFTIPYKYLLSDNTIEEVKSRVVENYISIAYNPDAEEYEKEFLDLLVLLLDLDALTQSSSDEKSSAEIRTEIYDNIKNHFATEDEFNTFVLSFILETSSAQEFYLKLFNERLKDDGITYYDFIRYTALTTYINKKTLTHFLELDSDTSFTIPIAYGDLVKMPQSEYEEYVHPYYESRLFDYRVAYQEYVREGYEILADNDLGYEELYNPNCRIDWQYGYLSPYYTSPYVTSDLISPKEGTYNGTKVIYYEYPEFYEDGEAVETFQNIKDEFTVRTVPGFKAEIIDDATGEPKYIYIVSIGGSIEEFKSVRFGTFHYSFDKAKNLSYDGGTYE